MARRIVLAFFITVTAAGCVVENAGGNRTAQLVAAILASNSREELDQRLKHDHVELEGGYLYIPELLFEPIASGSDRPEHWRALCRVDAWRDGAWHLEMKGAAYDALAHNPAAFAKRYLEGDDCALLLLMYAYAWVLQAADVQGIECADGGHREIQEYQRVVDSSEQAIFRSKAVDNDASRIRGDVLVEILTSTKDAWAATKTHLEAECRQEAD